VACGENLAAIAAAIATASPTGSAPAARTAEGSAAESVASSAGAFRPAVAAERPAEPPAALAPFLVVFSAIVVVGVVVAILIMRQLPARERLLATAQTSAPAAQDAAGDSNGKFPAGHPQVQIPKEALDFIARIQQKADANPLDPAAWDELGGVTLRAATFDPSYYPRSATAYAHVLKIDPDNLDALRGIGNIDFDQRKFDQAIAAYEHYLSKKPDDPEVRTDLGTMYLSTNNADEAVAEYRKVLERHPDFFEATFNLGVAYAQTNRRGDARAALATALKLAPDADARSRVNQMIASLNNAAPAASGSAPPAASGQVANSGTFQGALEQMLRDLPIAGPKVQSVQWPAAEKARVLMQDFPMDQMPPFATKKFLTDLKAGIDEVKSAHQLAAPVEVDICDAASGRVMQSVTE
jgi:tetratricopeptide (TPR) repeat protein